MQEAERGRGLSHCEVRPVTGPCGVSLWRACLVSNHSIHKGASKRTVGIIILQMGKMRLKENNDCPKITKAKVGQVFACQRGGQGTECSGLLGPGPPGRSCKALAHFLWNAEGALRGNPCHMRKAKCWGS